MTSPPPSNWQTSLKAMAFTLLVVAGALYLTAHLLLAVAPILIIVGLIVGSVAAAVAFVRYRRSRW